MNLTPWLVALASTLPQDPAPKGLVTRLEAAEPGHVLLAPLRSKQTLLVDEAGQVVQRWNSEFTPGHAAELLEDGSLLRAARVGDNAVFGGGGEGGLLERFSWEGERTWSFRLSSPELLQHHDFEVLPSGNILVLVWESRTQAEALAAGRRPDSVGELGMWPDAVLELRPVLPDGAEIVWAWHAWDHLVQDLDPALPNYADPAAHPERLDISINARALQEPESDADRQARLEMEAKLRALGYAGDTDEEDDEPAGSRERGRERGGADWMHTNSVDYDPELDLIVLSARNFGEVFVIDHSTTTEEAAGSSGGRHGRGGDLLWRWGNPRNYGRGSAEQQALFGQHDARWTREGRAPALTVFNNGQGRPGGDHSSVDLVLLPIDDSGAFTSPGDGACLPAQPTWTYVSPEKSDFYSSHISGAMRLPGGNLLICQGEAGRVFQVDRSGQILWEFVSPFGGEPGGPGRGGRGERRPGPGGEGRRGPPPERGQGPRGGPGRGPGGDAGTALFRAVHLPADHPGLAKLREEQSH